VERIRLICTLTTGNFVYSTNSPGTPVSFSELDPQFGGSGKYHLTTAGTTLYFSSEEEIRELFSPEFIIKDLKTIEVPRKPAPHKAVWLFAERR
jgi:hypothetical protein